MLTFLEYQLNKGLQYNTVKQQENAVNLFLEWCELEKITTKDLTYTEMIEYVSHIQQKKLSISSQRFKVKSLEHYFNYLNEFNNTNDANPVSIIKIKGMTRKIPHNLLSKEELQVIYSNQRSHGLAGKRDKVLLSLVVYQGVCSDELNYIETKDVYLEEGKIYIPATRRTNSRILELKPFQIILMQDYLMNIRPSIMRENKKVTDKLLVNVKHGKQEIRGVIYYLLKNLRLYSPQLKSLQQIRHSLITIWIKEYGLRQAQYMSGHKYVSSTERYNEHKMDGLKAEMDKYFNLEL